MCVCIHPNIETAESLHHSVLMGNLTTWMLHQVRDSWSSVDTDCNEMISVIHVSWWLFWIFWSPALIVISVIMMRKTVFMVKPLICMCVQTVLRRVSVSERRCCVQPGRRSVSSQNALQTVATARRSVTLLQDTAGASEWTAAGRCRAPLPGNLSFFDSSSLFFLPLLLASFDTTGL